jgi:hypothetical protein
MEEVLLYIPQFSYGLKTHSYSFINSFCLQFQMYLFCYRKMYTSP